MLSPRAIQFQSNGLRKTSLPAPTSATTVKTIAQTEYSEACLAAAEEEGIHRAEIEESVGNLHTYMAGAIDAAADKEVARSAKETE
jgi:hypothetical protein